MKTLIFFIVSAVLVFALNAETPVPSVYQSSHYNVTSYAGDDSAKSIADTMEALLLKYNQLFLFDLTKVSGALNVKFFASKADFDEALKGKTAATPDDFVYLQYADPTQSFLALYPKENSLPSIAFQGFFQFLWAYIPHPPAWIETGLAYQFWNVKQTGDSIDFSPDLPFLESIQKSWDKTPLDVSVSMARKESDDLPADANEYESWAIATFLSKSSDPTYGRLFGSILATLSPTATEEANQAAVLQRIKSVKSLEAFSADCMAFWKAVPTYNALVSQAVSSLKEKNYAVAKDAINKALAMRPNDFRATYYLGLAAYESKDYEQAEKIFAQAKTASKAPGLIPYAQGLTAFALKKWDDAKTYLQAATDENPEEYKTLAQSVVDLIK